MRERVVGRGAHTHFALHLPATGWHALRAQLEHRLQVALSFKSPTAVKITGGLGRNPGMTTERQRLGLIRYLGKALNPDEMVFTGTTQPLAEFLGIQTQRQAILPCKRAGYSENIGRSAQLLDPGFKQTLTVYRLMDTLFAYPRRIEKSIGASGARWITATMTS